MGSLAIIFKDPNLVPEAFSHLADLVIHHAPVDKGLRFGKKFKFEANQEELDRLKWLGKFADINALYCYDRDEEVRERLFTERNQSFRSQADVILVQYKTQLKIVKSSDGVKHSCIPFIEASYSKPSQIVSNIFNADFLAIRMEVLSRLGTSCDSCGYGDCLQDLLLVQASGELLEFSQFGLVKSINKLLTESVECSIMCSRCYHERKYGMTDGHGIHLVKVA